MLHSILFAFCKFHFHFYFTIANVIFWYGKCLISHKISYGSFQGVTLVLMSHTYHVDMYYIHSQSSMHCHTSVFIIVAKCIFSVTLGESCYISVALRGFCCSYVLSDKLCFIDYSNCVIIFNFFLFQFDLTNPTLSQNLKTHFLSNFTQPS